VRVSAACEGTEEQQVPPLRRRIRSVSGRNDDLMSTYSAVHFACRSAFYMGGSQLAVETGFWRLRVATQLGFHGSQADIGVLIERN